MVDITGVRNLPWSKYVHGEERKILFLFLRIVRTRKTTRFGVNVGEVIGLDTDTSATALLQLLYKVTGRKKAAEEEEGNRSRKEEASGLSE
ncbi:hypothetical protein ILYODFUR_010141 [Ilyodon furcidens]|uniref:Uncharacterized protein n=1 Tax=Ilyodon furcidens TaxID=33524 RepID=A0ABV0UHP8_9TELE